MSSNVLRLARRRHAKHFLLTGFIEQALVTYIAAVELDPLDDAATKSRRLHNIATLVAEVHFNWRLRIGDIKGIDTSDDVCKLSLIIRIS